MKRIVAFLCVVALMLGVVNPAVFASDSATAATNGTQTYSSLQAAVDGYTDGVIVLEENASNITVNRDTYVDLNGHSIENVTVTGGTLYCADSETADYTVADGVYGKVTGASGSVQAADGYLQIADDGAVSFHRLNLDIYAMTLRASAVGVYYKSHFAGDELVAQQVESFGVALSVVAAPNASNLKQHCGYSAFTGFKAGEGANSGNATGTLLRDIMKPTNTDKINTRNAAMPVYGRAYIKTAEGYVFGTAVKRNLREQVEAIDGLWNGLQDTQKAPVTAMYETYASVMEGWNIPNIKGIQTPGTNDAIEIPVDVTVENGIVTEEMTIEDQGITVTVPAGTKLAEGESMLTVVVTPKEESDAGLTLDKSQVLMPMDVHVDGIAADNAAPLTIHLGKIMPENLNMGNYTVYHVENGMANEMTLIAATEEFTAHNQYKYTLDGELTLYMATFSEVAVVSEKAKWEGGFDYSWYDADATELEIRNADQLAAFGAIVGGMKKVTDMDDDGSYVYSEEIIQDSFSGKTVKLMANISIGDTVADNGKVFYPIGYYNNDGTYEKTNAAITSGFKTFEGIFDGNGNTISDFYQNTWEMKGDHNWYDATLQYYRDGMGLFGKVYGGTVKNLTVDNFKSDGEITTTGVIAAYADCGATFENISIFNCNPRVYNIGNGGIVGCVGWYANTTTENENKVSFRNITVDNSNKISALWGSYDVACGGIVGQYYPTSGQTNAIDNAGIYMENCHVSAQMDVYNDVCANYQYYAYRYTGMLIGSVRENLPADENGHVYPNMDGITASGCTVHFGDWNDYYYCELVANSLASYTHDHQMSRLEQVAKVEGTTITPLEGEAFTVPASGRYNYVVVKNKDKETGMWIHGDGHDFAECYHFVNGVQHFHDVADSDNPDPTETVDGVEGVLKEDKQLVYREFNNLVTGYGWGVTSRGLSNIEGVTKLDVEHSDNEKSVEKFAAVSNEVKSYTTNGTVKIGELFAAKSGAIVEIKGDKVQVTVSPADKDSTASGTYAANTTDWTQGTLTFTGIGAATITITDYYFCTPTTIEVEVAERKEEVKFDVVMNNGDFLHRVGNSGTVALGKLFEAKDDATIGNVSVTVEALNGTAASGTYTSNATWTNGTIQFKDTGVVKVTITDNDYCIPTELYLEVVDAVNATTATSATSNNVVLLNDISSGFTVSGRYTVYGNGFTLNYTGKGQYLNNGLTHGIVVVKDSGTLDNLRIVASIYPVAYMYYGYTAYADYVQNGSYDEGANGKQYHYQLSAVEALGNATISNCYIYGARNNIYVSTGNVIIKDTILECGTVANVQIQSTNEYTVTFENVTTIQHKVNPTVGDTSLVMLGAGVLVGPETEHNPTIVLDGYFKQYNWVSDEDKAAVSNTMAQAIIQGALEATAYNHTVNGKTASNLGIIYMNTSAVNVTNNTGLPYVRENIKITPEGLGGNSVDGQVCSLQNATEEQIYSDYANADRSTVNGDYLPAFNFDLGDQAISYDGSEDTRYLYGDANGVTALYQDGDAELTLDLSKLATIYKYTGLNYTYTAVCKDSSGKELNVTDNIVTLNAQGSYTLEFTIEDNIFYDKDGNRIEKSVERVYTVPLTLTVKEADVKNAEVSITKTALDGEYTTVNLTDYKLRIDFLDCISVTDYDNTGAGTTVDLTSNISSATLTPASVNVYTTASTITITYTDGRELTVNLSAISGSAPGSPKTATINTSGSVYFISDSALDNKPTESNNQNKCTITSVSYKGNSGSTVTNDTDVTVTWELGSSSGGGGCVTSDTLVTLADGSQKRIDELGFDDKILAWDFFTGTYTEQDISLLVNHGEDFYKVANLEFSDGTLLRLIADHGVFDYNLNKYVYITVDNMGDYIGHRFVQYSADGGYNIVTLTSAYETEEYIAAWSVSSAITSNAFASGMLTVAPPDDFYNWIEMDSKLHYDVEQFEKDVETYGLYTYDVFAEYVTYEQFVAFNGAYLKIPVEKGLFTFEYILELIDLYVGWMPQ